MQVIKWVCNAVSTATSSIGNIAQHKNAVAPSRDVVVQAPVDIRGRPGYIVDNVHYFKPNPGAAKTLLEQLDTAIRPGPASSGKAIGEHRNPKFTLGILAQALSLGCRNPGNDADDRPNHELAGKVLDHLRQMHLADGFSKHPREHDEFAWRTLVQLNASEEGRALRRAICRMPGASESDAHERETLIDDYLKIAGELIRKDPSLPAYPALLIGSLDENDTPASKIEKEALAALLDRICALAGGKHAAEPVPAKNRLCVLKARQNISEEHERLYDDILKVCPGYLRNSTESKTKFEAAMDTLAKRKSTPFESLKLIKAAPGNAAKDDPLDQLKQMVCAQGKREKLELGSEKNKGVDFGVINALMPNGCMKVFPVLSFQLAGDVNIRIAHTHDTMRLSIFTRKSGKGELGAGMEVGVGIGAGPALVGAAIISKAKLLQSRNSQESELHLEVPVQGNEDKQRFATMLEDVFRRGCTVDQLLMAYPGLQITGGGRTSRAMQMEGEVNGLVAAKCTGPGKHVGLGIGAGSSLTVTPGLTSASEVANNSTRRKEVKDRKSDQQLTGEPSSEGGRTKNIFTLETRQDHRAFAWTYLKGSGAESSIAGVGKNLAGAKTGREQATITREQGRIKKVKTEETVKDKDKFIRAELKAASDAHLPQNLPQPQNLSSEQSQHRRERALRELRILQLANAGSDITAQRLLTKEQIDQLNQYQVQAELAIRARNYQDARRFTQAANDIIDRVHEEPVTKYNAIRTQHHTDELKVTIPNPFSKTKATIDISPQKILPVQHSRVHQIKQSHKVVYDPAVTAPKPSASAEQAQRRQALLTQAMQQSRYVRRRKKDDVPHFQ